MGFVSFWEFQILFLNIYKLTNVYSFIDIADTYVPNEIML